MTKKKTQPMNITVKMEPAEIEAFNNYMANMKPPTQSEEDFIRNLFFLGAEHLNKLIMEAQQQEAMAKTEDVPQEETPSGPTLLKD
jgi:hypothetical protein